MKLTSIETGRFKLDGGAMFGVVPKSMWQRLNAPDDMNLCTWAMRCLLIETNSRRILIDTGIGDKQGEKFRSHFHPHGVHDLLSSIRSAGLNAEDITDVFLTHLHFDHVGGAVRRDSNGRLLPTFPNATYWSNKAHYDWALDPNPRERASFLKENFVPLHAENRLRFVDVEQNVAWIEGIRLRFCFGHTEAMMLPMIPLPDGRTLVYCADLLPSHGHIGLPYVMSYDIRPLETMEEKKVFFEDALRDDYVLFFEHDKDHACGTLRRNEKGRVVIDQLGSLAEFVKQR